MLALVAFALIFGALMVSQSESNKAFSNVVANDIKKDIEFEDEEKELLHNHDKLMYTKNSKKSNPIEDDRGF